MLTSISKIFERFISKQISNLMEPFFKKQCDFRKGYNTQYFLFSLLGNEKSAVDKGIYFGALLTDLSETLDCFSHELLLAKLHPNCMQI